MCQINPDEQISSRTNSATDQWRADGVALSVQSAERSGAARSGAVLCCALWCSGLKSEACYQHLTSLTQ